MPIVTVTRIQRVTFNSDNYFTKDPDTIIRVERANAESEGDDYFRRGSSIVTIEIATDGGSYTDVPPPKAA